MTSQPHDALFKAIFSQPERAAELLRSFLDPQLVARIDWRSLRQHQGSHVNKELAAHYTDLLFTARVDRRQKIFIYFLLEHKSKPERWVGLYLLRNMVNIWMDHIRDFKKIRRLPPILPAVIYHGEREWKVDPEFSTLIDCPEDLPGLAASVPRFRFALADLATVDAETLRKGGGSAAVRMALLALKETRAAHSLKDLLLSWATVLNELEREAHGEHAIEFISRYLVAVRKAEEFDDIDFHALGLVKTSEAIMTRETYMFEKGVEKGIAKGIEKGVEKGQRALFLKQLHGKFSALPPAVVARVETADHDSLEQWSLRLLSASSLDEVFADAAA